jgi:outer membrane protein OmpA-like peptidoglycan-associated protein/flagellar hook assembly protein FlgD
MIRTFRALALAAVLVSAIAAPAFAYDPPAGGLLLPLLGCPEAAAPGLSVTALDSPWADRLNPAASAAQQRTVVAFGYDAITDFGSQGLGTGLAMGLSVPKPYGVWGAGLRMVSVPASMTSLPLGTAFTGSVSLAKDLFPNLYVGVGVDVSLGADNGFGWGAGLDLGFIHFLGDVGPLLDLRWGGVLSDIGKGYTTPSPSTGFLGTAAGDYPPSFTPAFGAEALFVRTTDWKIGAGASFNVPSFQDFGLDLEGKATFKNVVSLRMGWGVDARELMAGTSRSLLPSLTISGTIPIVRKSDDSFVSRNGWDRGDASPTVVARPLYGKVWDAGIGLVMRLGIIDKTPPVISAKFPGSQWGPCYISPNNDGIQDTLTMPVTITDERYLESYALIVYAGDRPDASPGRDGEVRTINNKEPRPEEAGFTGLWQHLVYVKKGLASPGTLTWDGRADDGSVVPDGAYSVVIEAFDDNGNRGTAGPFKVVVKITPPSATMVPADESKIFSPDGDSNKDTLLFRMSGSVEDLWTLKFLDAGGAVQRKVEYKNSAPTDFTWDGKTDGGSVVPDGVYSAVLQSTDRAGNSTTVRVDNIVVNTQQPPINVAIDLPAFSPNGDGVKDTLTITPSVPVKTGLTSWRLAVVDKNRTERWSMRGSDPQSLPDRYAYNGQGSNGVVLPEGQYQVELSVTYLNGYSPKILSPFFVVDLTAPKGAAQADRGAFNPTGSTDQNHVTFNLTGDKDAVWKAEVLGSSGSAVRTWTMSPRPDATLDWDGADDQGKPVPDGIYAFRLSAMDRAGNSFVSQTTSISLDTQKKSVRVSADARAFNSQRTALKLTPSVLAKDKLKTFELTVEAADAQPGSVVRSWKGAANLADSYSWDGMTAAGARAADGRYVARIKVSYQNGDMAEATSSIFVVDTVAPTVSASAAPLLFSRNGRLNSVAFTQTSSTEDSWTGRILAADGTVVRSYSWKGQAQNFSWDGTDEAGNVMMDGVYSYEVQAVDAAGNKGQTSVTGITMDNRPVSAFVTASETGISPKAGSAKSSMFFTTIVNLKDGIAGWKFALVDNGGVERRAFTGGSSVPARIDWDGKDSKGAVVEGVYVGVLTVDYLKGDRATARTGSILVDITGPVVRITTSPDLFSPDNSGVNDELKFSINVGAASDISDWELDINENAVTEGAAPGATPAQRLFISWNGKGMPAPVITWDGRSSKGELVQSATDYPYSFTVRDVLGNATTATGTISVDVLVVRDGDRLKIQVPSIVFRANYADFVGLDQSTLDNNAKVIKRIAEILNKFKDYRIQIEGHANSEGKINGYSAAKIADEETKELVPLSLARANLVRQLLVQAGVDGPRLSTIGLGSSEPVVDFKDAVNRWKNRRVEFVLIKNQ